MNSLNLNIPKRQSTVGVAVIYLKNLRRAVNFFLAVIFVQFGTNFNMLGMGITEWGILLALIFLVISYLQYRKFFFYIKGDQFIIEKGVLRQEKINVPFGRIQTVNTTQNVIQQFFGVVGLKIDTAGSVGQEIEISALEKNYALQLQDYLMEKKFEESGDSNEEFTDANEKTQSFAGEKPLVHLKPIDLFKVGFTENHLRSGLVLFAIVNGYVWQYEEYLLKPFEPYLERTATTILASWVLLLPIIFILFLVISVLYSLIRVGLQYFELKLFLNASGVQLRSGLLRKNEYRVPHNKIQYLKWSSNPLRRIVGYKTLKIKQAGSEAQNAKRSVVIPGVKNRPLIKVLQTFYTNRKSGVFSNYKAHYLLFIQYFVWGGVFPAIMVAIAFYVQGFSWLFYLPLLGALAVAYYLFYRYYRTVGIRVNTQVIEIKKGWLFPAQVCLKHYKLQNLKLSQTYFQRKRNLASLTFYTAAGSETMPHLNEGIAHTLYNYLLYKIESSEKGWM